jgi:hypothetical protein
MLKFYKISSGLKKNRNIVLYNTEFDIEQLNKWTKFLLMWVRFLLSFVSGKLVLYIPKSQRPGHKVELSKILYTFVGDKKKKDIYVIPTIFFLAVKKLIMLIIRWYPWENHCPFMSSFPFVLAHLNWTN